MVTLECLQEITIFTLYLTDKRGQFTFPLSSSHSFTGTSSTYCVRFCFWNAFEMKCCHVSTNYKTWWFFIDFICCMAKAPKSHLHNVVNGKRLIWDQFMHGKIKTLIYWQWFNINWCSKTFCSGFAHLAMVNLLWNILWKGSNLFENLNLFWGWNNCMSKKKSRQDSNVYTLLELKWNSAEGKIVPWCVYPSVRRSVRWSLRNAFFPMSQIWVKMS